LFKPKDKVLNINSKELFLVEKRLIGVVLFLTPPIQDTQSKFYTKNDNLKEDFIF